MRIAVVTVRPEHKSQYGGAERLFDGLVGAFRDIGHEADEVPLQVDESNFEGIQRGYLACYDLDLSRYDVVVSTKAPTWLVRHPRHVCYLVHTMRVFYDMFETTFPQPTPALLRQRELIHKLDTGSLAPPRCKAVFAIGEEVASRLRETNGIEATALHPPLWADCFRDEGIGDYFFLPGRLHRWKRVDLVVDAFKRLERDVRLLIAGQGEEEEALRRLAGADRRIRFLGSVSDDELIGLYAKALAVPFAPRREDYGYVTLEAFASGKPVITCSDSGEAAAIVRDGVNGRVVDPDPVALAGAFAALVDDPGLAQAMGASGRGWVRGLSWSWLAQRLLAAATDIDRREASR